MLLKSNDKEGMFTKNSCGGKMRQRGGQEDHHSHRHASQDRQDAGRLVLDLGVDGLDGRERCDRRPVPQQVQVLLARQLADHLVRGLEQRPDAAGLLHLLRVHHLGKGFLAAATAAAFLAGWGTTAVAIGAAVVVVGVVGPGVGRGRRPGPLRGRRPEAGGVQRCP